MGSHHHSIVAGWFVLRVEVSIAVGSWLQLGQQVSLERENVAAESSFNARSSWFMISSLLESFRILAEKVFCMVIIIFPHNEDTDIFELNNR